MNTKSKYVVEVIKQAKKITKLKLASFLFLIDLHASEEWGEVVTGFKYPLYFYGPYPKDLDEVLSKLASDRYIEYKEINDSGSYRYFLIIPGENIDRISTDLSLSELQLLQGIVNKYKDLPFDILVENIYKMDIVKDKYFGDTVL